MGEYAPTMVQIPMALARAETIATDLVLSRQLLLHCSTSGAGWKLDETAIAADNLQFMTHSKGNNVHRWNVIIGHCGVIKR